MRYLPWFLLILLVFLRQVTDRPIYQDGDRIRIATRVTSEPIRYANSQGLSLVGLKIYLPKFPEISYGDYVVVEGVVENVEGHSGKRLKNAVLIKSEEGSGFLYQIRKQLINVYQKSLPMPHSALVSGVTLGSKANLPADFWEALKATGTAHVVVASGMNVTLVANFLINFLVLFLPRRRAVFVALVGIWSYSLLSGFDAPIVRAAIMGSIGFSAQALGRLYDAWRGLFASVLAMLIVKPEWISDLGFILSFVATASLILFERKIRTKLVRLPSIVREDFSTSLAAQIGVAPILWATFGQFNFLSPVVNALVLWTIAPITIIGMISGLVGLIVPLLARLILFVTYPMTSWFVYVVQLFS